MNDEIMKIKALVLTLAVLVSACSSTDKTEHLKHFKYEAGVTTRDQVIEALGLPDVSESTDAVEMIGYKGAADGSDFFIPLPVAYSRVNQDTIRAFYTDIGPSQQSKVKKCDIVFFFNKDKKLINATRPSAE